MKRTESFLAFFKKIVEDNYIEMKGDLTGNKLRGSTFNFLVRNSNIK